MLRNGFLFFVLFLSVTTTFAQLNGITIGDAVDQGNNCFIITPDELQQAGGVWYDNPIDFADDFSISYQNNFGTKDIDGADGMALVFKRDPNPRIGTAGGGIGFEGIFPSLVIEFDTFENEVNGDIAADHIAILRDASPRHNEGTNLAGPIQASSSNINIEDGTPHEIKIEWIASSETLTVFFDCELRLSLSLDIKNGIFSGDSSIFFGFVGSTGGFSNLNQVCFNNVTFVVELNLENTAICQGSNESVAVDATVPNGVSYNWSPTTGVSDPTIANPTLTPTVTTTYTVTITNVCGETITEDITISVNPPETPIFDPIAPICEGDTNPLQEISNNGVTGTWVPIFNNTQTTTYTFTPTGNCGPSVTLTIEVVPNITPVFDEVLPICQGESLLPLAIVSNNGIVGSWSPTLNNNQTTTYTFSPDDGQGCVLSTDLVIEVIPVPSFSLDLDFASEPFSGNQDVTINVVGGDGTYEYQLDNGPWVDTNVFENLTSCQSHIVRVREISSCNNVIDQTFQIFDYPKFFTPNGDAHNNYWNIDCLENQPNSTIRIFDRYGMLLTQISPSGSGWDGTFNGNLMPSADYWFKVDYLDNNGLARVFSSHFALKR